MEEPKFKGKRVDDGQWEYGFYLMSRGKSYISCLPDKAEKLAVWVEVISESVGQYIRRLDKNGREIYEDDILRVTEDIRAQVVFYLDGFKIKTICKQSEILSRFYSWHMCEIIGNKHNKPESNEPKYCPICEYPFSGICGGCGYDESEESTKGTKLPKEASQLVLKEMIRQVQKIREFNGGKEITTPIDNMLTVVEVNLENIMEEL